MYETKLFFRQFRIIDFFHVFEIGRHFQNFLTRQDCLFLLPIFFVSLRHSQISGYIIPIVRGQILLLK